MSAPVATLTGIAKRYGDVRALEGLDVEVPAGPVGLLGPNGAGKTTLIQLLLGLLRPESGTARIAGHDPSTRAGRREIRRRVGYMPEGDCLVPGMNGLELCATLARLTGLSAVDAMTRAHEVLDYAGLEEERYRNLDQYSTGMKQRLKLAQALVHDPQILFLDEPTNGLDPRGRGHMLELIADLGHARGKNVVLSSHLLPDVERTCDHVLVLHRGRLVEQGSVAALTAAHAGELRFRLGGEEERRCAALAATGWPATDQGRGWFTVPSEDPEGDVARLFSAASRAGAVVTEVQPVRPTLEEVFLSSLEEGGS